MRHEVIKKAKPNCLKQSSRSYIIPKKEKADKDEEIQIRRHVYFEQLSQHQLIHVHYHAATNTCPLACSN
jgi:hypothetical protein